MSQGPGFRPVDTDALGIHRVPAEIDTSVAHPARVYDYVLGGKDNWPADREVAERMMALIPTAENEARANRAFLRRAVRYAANRGVTQFLDIGTGIPTVGPTHETAHAVDRSARVVYVDNDPVVLAHARALLVEDDLTYVIQADVRDPESILNNPETRRRLDFGEPIALMFVGLFYFLSDDDAEGLIEQYARELAPGSLLLLTHVLDTPELRAGKEVYKATSPIVPRSPRQIAELVAGWDLVEPGLVPVHEWRPDPGDENGPPAAHMLGGVGVKP